MIHTTFNSINLDSPTIHNLRNRKVTSFTKACSSTSHSAITTTTVVNQCSSMCSAVSTNSNSIAYSFLETTLLMSSISPIIDSNVESVCTIDNLINNNDESDSNESESSVDDICQLKQWIKLVLITMIFLLDILIKNCPKLFSMGFYYTKDYITKKGSFIINIYLFYWFENIKKNI